MTLNTKRYVVTTNKRVYHLAPGWESCAGSCLQAEPACVRIGMELALELCLASCNTCESFDMLFFVTHLLARLHGLSLPHSGWV